MKISPTGVKHIADLCGAKIIGNKDAVVTGINEIHRVQPGDLAFVDHPKYYEKTLQSAATVILIDKETSVPENKCLLIHPEPFKAFNQILKHFFPPKIFEKEIAPDAEIGAGTIIMPGVKIGSKVKIGKHCHIFPNVVIYPGTEIGDEVIIHAGSIIGSDAFYFKKNSDGKHVPLYSSGKVVIEDGVNIGSNCTIDRGVTSATRIGKYSILDNMVHVGHDVEIGESCLMAAQVGIAGYVKIGSHVKIWGQAGINSSTIIEDHAIIYAQSGVTGHISHGSIMFGTPAGNAREKMKEISALKYLPDLVRNGKK
jgi:UDP-3-O-[3-hydroxymyristoyl] glucosamine N-acyltransferase